MAQLISEDLCVLLRSKVTVRLAPPGDGGDHAAYQLADAMLSLRTPQRTTKIFGDHDVSRHLRPRFRNFHLRLLKDHVAFLIGNRGRTNLPLDFIIRTRACTREVTIQMKPLFGGGPDLDNFLLALHRRRRSHLPFSFLNFPLCSKQFIIKRYYNTYKMQNLQFPDWKYGFQMSKKNLLPFVLIDKHSVILGEVGL